MDDDVDKDFDKIKSWQTNYDYIQCEIKLTYAFSSRRVSLTISAFWFPLKRYPEESNYIKYIQEK